MPLEAETREHQEALARACRTGIIESVLGVKDGRAEVYRGLIRNGVDDALRRAYPLTYQLLSIGESPTKWSKLVDSFLASEKLVSPELWRMPEQLVHFVRNRGYSAEFDMPFLEELLAFEWVEVELYMMPDRAYLPVQPVGDILADKLVINPEHEILKYSYPVFKVPVLELTAATQGQYFAAAYRDMESGRVRFMELSPPLAALLEQLAKGPLSGADCIKVFRNIIASTIDSNIIADFENKIVLFLEGCLKEGLILGAQRNTGDSDESDY